MKVANKIKIDDETEANLPEMSQLFLNPLTDTSNNDGIYQSQEYSCGKFNSQLMILINLCYYRFDQH